MQHSIIMVWYGSRCNIPLDTLQAIAETTFPANFLTGAKNQSS